MNFSVEKVSSTEKAFLEPNLLNFKRCSCVPT